MIREKAIHKIEQDYHEFRNEMFSLPSNELYSNAYMISLIAELYSILTVENKLSQKMLKNIVLFKGNILEQLYYEWVRSGYTNQDHLEDVIRDTLKSLQREVKLCA